MRAEVVDQPICPRAVAIEHEILTEEPHPLGWVAIQIGGGRDRMPVATHQLASRRPRPHAGQLLVQFLADCHRCSALQTFLGRLLQGNTPCDYMGRPSYPQRSHYPLSSQSLAGAT